MSRLTEYQKAQKWLEGFDCDNEPEACDNLATICEALQEMDKIKDKQEQGLLLVLKAKVGDDIFKIINGVISRLRITRIEVTNYGIEYFVWGYTLTNEGYGVTWFSTESEAESALAKMGGM